ncbi:MAG: choice-of-anchor D domain-containing protein, partial [Betaproteobacteria bacterium]
TALTFAAQTIATTSAVQNVIITNTGFANLTFSSITVSGPFSRAVLSATSSDCASSLAPSSSCQIGISFTPTSTGVLSGQLTINDNASGSPHIVILSGTGTSVPVAVISVSSGIAFGDQIINTASGAQLLTISNTGTATLITSAITLTGANASNFSLTGQGGCASIPAGASCVVGVGFTPATTGAKTAQINLTSNAQNAATVNTISLTGNGILASRPVINVTTTAIGFGNVIFGGATPNQIVTLTNTGGQALSISSIVVTGDFLQTNNCGTSVPTQGTCTINIVFTPLAQGARSGELLLTTNAATSPDRVPLSGTGCRWFSQAQSRFFLTACGN